MITDQDLAVLTRDRLEAACRECQGMRADRYRIPVEDVTPFNWVGMPEQVDETMSFHWLELEYHPRFTVGQPFNALGTLSHPDPRVQARLDEVWNRPNDMGGALSETHTTMQWSQTIRLDNFGVSPSTPAPPKPSHKLLLSILGEMGSAIAALWDTDDQGRITNPCPQCGKPAWQCDDHMPVPNDLRIKAQIAPIEARTGKGYRRKQKRARQEAKTNPPPKGIEWTDEAGRYHRLEDEYLAEAGLENERIYRPDWDPSGEHAGGGEWFKDKNGKLEFRVTPGQYIKHHGAILMSKALSKKDRKAFLEMCRRLDRAEALMNPAVTVRCPIPTWLPYDTIA